MANIVYHVWWRQPPMLTYLANWCCSAKLSLPISDEISFAQLLESRLGHDHCDWCEPWVAGFLLRLPQRPHSESWVQPVYSTRFYCVCNWWDYRNKKKIALWSTAGIHSDRWPSVCIQCSQVHSESPPPSDSRSAQGTQTLGFLNNKRQSVFLESPLSLP